LNAQLTALGLQKPRGSVKGEYNKFIPREYMQSSVEQREALLQGLMDADGSIDRRNGKVEFGSSDPILAADVLELILSLGYRARKIESDSYLNGKYCGKRYRITFTPWRPVFRLTRKLEHQRLSDEAPSRIRYRYITGIEAIDSVPVKCIMVDSPNS